jgi:hypothetical protein
MPPQQPDGLLDLIDDGLNFRAHRIPDPLLARNLMRLPQPRKPRSRAARRADWRSRRNALQ